MQITIKTTEIQSNTDPSAIIGDIIHTIAEDMRIVKHKIDDKQVDKLRLTCTVCEIEILIER